MSEYNPSAVVKRLPDCIERIEKAHFQGLDNLYDMAKQMADTSGDVQFQQTVAEMRKAIDSMQEYVRRMVGKEGDTTEGEGSLWAYYTSAQKILKVMGGE